jgi:hypothetical protein
MSKRMKKLSVKERIALKKKWKRIMVRLSWHILELKFLYYDGAKYGLKAPDDSYYDAIEDKYKKLAERLKIAPTASDMVGFNYDRGSCKLVADRMISTKGKIKKFKI